jgi:hypothetical protein
MRQVRKLGIQTGNEWYDLVMRVSILWGMGAFLGASAAHADFSGWTDSTRVRFNTTSSGAGVSADVADFPVLVRLTSADFPFAEARADGADLRFADSAGAALAFELERFDAAAKQAEAWVLVPVVKGNSAAQWIKMYWGNPSATPASSGPAVLGAAKGFGGVWHLGEAGNTSAGGYKDASGAGNHGTGQGGLGAFSSVAGAVGRATLFQTSAAQGVSVPAAASLHPTGGLTVEAWINSTSQGPFRRFVGKPFTSAAAPWNEYSLEADATGSLVNFSLNLDGNEAHITGTTSMANGTWYHVAGTWDGANQKVYVNGVLEATLARTGSVPDYGQALSIGKYGMDGFSNFDGAVDEARVSRTARGAGWIKLEYANQKPAQSLVTFEKFPVNPGCLAVFKVPADTVVKEGATVSLSARADCATGYSWSVVSGPAPRILDPEAKVLQVRMPRVTADTVLVYRFSADIAGTARTGDVRVTLKEAIPDPAFTLPATQPWDAKDSLIVRPSVSNAAAMQAAGAGTLRYAWTLAGLTVDSSTAGGRLKLTHPSEGGTLAIGLCLDNGGEPVCQQTTVLIAAPATLLRPRPAAHPAFARSGRHWDARGRALPLAAPKLRPPAR